MERDSKGRFLPTGLPPKKHIELELDIIKSIIKKF